MHAGKLVYEFFLGAFGLGAKIGSLFSDKTRKWVEGRRNLMLHWQQELARVPNRSIRPLVWLHASSLGEFEQVWPLAEALRKAYPDMVIAVSFFSPSGYEVVRKKKLADACGYLPFDNDSTLSDFITLLNPDLVLWAKYDFWYNTLKIISKGDIPILLVSAIFREGQPFFRPWGALHRQMLGYFTHIFVQDDISCNLLKTIGLNVDILSISGDTRFDRVQSIAANWQPVPGIDAWLSGAKALVAGSTWPEDHRLLAEAMAGVAGMKLILAPHEVGKEKVAAAREIFPASIMYSQWLAGDTTTDARILIMDNVGLLSRLYKYGQLAYVGGGFSKTGVHNVLEPATYGIPVLFGPRHQKYREVGQLMEAGGGVQLQHAPQINDWIHHASAADDTWKAAAVAAKKFVQDNAGATAMLMDYIQRNRLLTRP